MWGLEVVLIFNFAFNIQIIALNKHCPPYKIQFYLSLTEINNANFNLGNVLVLPVIL